MPVKNYIVHILIVGMMVIGLTACAQTQEPSDNANNETTATISTNTTESPSKSLYNLKDDYPDLDEENLFIVSDAEGTFKFLEHGTGVLMLGFPDCPWCQVYLPMLDDLAKTAGIKKIVYYDTKKSRIDQPEDYAKLLELLDEKGTYTEYNNDGEKRIFVPFMVTIDHGEIKYMNHDTCHLDSDEISPEEYWTDEMKTTWEDSVLPHLEDIKEAMAKCDDCSD